MKFSCSLRSLLLEDMIWASFIMKGVDFSPHYARCWEYNGEQKNSKNK